MGASKFAKWVVPPIKCNSRLLHSRCETRYYNNSSASSLNSAATGLYLTTPPILLTPTSSPGHELQAKWITFHICGAADDDELRSSGDTRSRSNATSSGYATYQNSQSWYDASILRPITKKAVREPLEEIIPSERNDIANFHPLLKEKGWALVEYKDKLAWRVHKTLTSHSQPTWYSVTWIEGVPKEVGNPLAMGNGAGFLENLREGDRVALWVRVNVRHQFLQHEPPTAATSGVFTGRTSTYI